MSIADAPEMIFPCSRVKSLRSPPLLSPALLLPRVPVPARSAEVPAFPFTPSTKGRVILL